jgi:hypothetical protein
MIKFHNNSTKDFLNSSLKIEAFCNSMSPRAFYIINNTINMIGLVTNSICIFVFILIIKKERQSSNMFHYLLAKSSSDFLLLLFYQYEWIFYCETCTKFKDGYLSQILYIYIWWYGGSVCTMSSMAFELAAIFDCYSLLSEKFEFLRKKSFFFITLSIVYAFSFVLCIFIPLTLVITPKINSGYIVSQKMNSFFLIGYLTTTSIKEYLLVSLLIMFNILIFFKMKELSNIRKRMSNKQLNLIKEARTAEQNKVKMIVTSCFNTVLLHLPNSVFVILYEFDILHCYYNLVLLFYVISYSNTIIFYILYNKSFRKIFINYFTFKKQRQYFFRNIFNNTIDLAVIS